jgi:CMP-N-acetylneuraminic acid synthetase
LKHPKSPRIICIIPARQGSKGLRRKNLRLVGGFTLVNRAIRVARSIEEPVYIILSSDDELILTKYKKKVDRCIKRKTELSTDNSLITDVIKDALQDLTDFNDEEVKMELRT